MRVCISTCSILFTAGVVFKLMFISLKCCESAQILLSIHSSASPLSYEFYLCMLWGQCGRCCPPMGWLMSCLPPSASDITVWRLMMEPGSEIPCRLNSSLLYFSLMCVFVGFLCVLWFTALCYRLEEEAGKEAGSPLIKIITVTAPTHQIGELNSIWYC